MNISTRNYYIHGDRSEKYPRRIKEALDMYDVNQQLRTICLYYIYTELDIPREDILNIL